MIINTQAQIEKIKNEISRDIRNALGSKLYKIILYGSYARGDYNEDSDIDIMVLADIEEDKARAYREALDTIADRVSLENNALVVISLRNTHMFYSRLEILPFYQNVIKDGVEIYGH